MNTVSIFDTLAGLRCPSCKHVLNAVNYMLKTVFNAEILVI